MKRPYLFVVYVIVLLACGFMLGILSYRCTLKAEDGFLEHNFSSDPESMMSPEHTKHQLIAVFKKNISEAQAIAIVTSWNVNFSQGMDSSKGKSYFYDTGDKFILTFENEEQLNAFKRKRYQFLPEVHEIYSPDWLKQKD